MPWVKLTDDYFEDEAIEAASPEAKLLFIAGLCYSASKLTDGLLPEKAIKKLAEKCGFSQRSVRERAEELVVLRLWKKRKAGHMIHRYLKYNPSAKEVKEQRQWDASRSSIHRNSALVAAIRDRDGSQCRYCGTFVRWTDRRGPRGATYDHIIPRGPSTLENLVVACRQCNSSKSNRSLEEAGMTLLPPPDLVRSRSD